MTQTVTEIQGDPDTFCLPNGVCRLRAFALVRAKKVPPVRQEFSHHWTIFRSRRMYWQPRWLAEMAPRSWTGPPELSSEAAIFVVDSHRKGMIRALAVARTRWVDTERSFL